MAQAQLDQAGVTSDSVKRVAKKQEKLDPITQEIDALQKELGELRKETKETTAEVVEFTREQLRKRAEKLRKRAKRKEEEAEARLVDKIDRDFNAYEEWLEQEYERQIHEHEGDHERREHYAR